MMSANISPKKYLLTPIKNPTNEKTTDNKILTNDKMADIKFIILFICRPQIMVVLYKIITESTLYYYN